MVQEAQAVGLKFAIEHGQASKSKISISVPASIVDVLFNEASLAQRRNIEAQGFAKGKIPLNYVQENYSSTLLEHITELLFNYFVISFLYEQIRHHKLLVAGEPRLISIDLEPHQDAHFHFDVTMMAHLPVAEWKYLPFKAPQRKNYKDLDRQVESFIKEEKELQEKANPNVVNIGDWVNFDVFLSDDASTPLITAYHERLWLKIGDEEADAVFQDLFLGHAIGDVICTKNVGIQNYFSAHDITDYYFCVRINDIVSNGFFSLDNFKNYFRLKTNKAMHQKLIEAFSYRNDISQRRAMVEESLRLLLSKHRFNVPNHLILRQQKMILDHIYSNPDYHVYRAQPDFQASIRKLAEKQAKEMLLLDHVAYQENIMVDHDDVKNYLNLTLRPRTKEFIYFDPPTTKIAEQEMPISQAALEISCMREKTLNHIIYYLTR